MPDAMVFVERKGTLVLESGIEVKIVEAEGGGLRLIVDRPLSYCEDIIVFEGEEEDKEQSATAPIRRLGPPPLKRTAAVKKRRDSRQSVMDMFD